jgi:hypothetical protein
LQKRVPVEEIEAHMNMRAIGPVAGRKQSVIHALIFADGCPFTHCFQTYAWSLIRFMA